MSCATTFSLSIIAFNLSQVSFGRFSNTLDTEQTIPFCFLGGLDNNASSALSKLLLERLILCFASGAVEFPRPCKEFGKDSVAPPASGEFVTFFSSCVWVVKSLRLQFYTST